MITLKLKMTPKMKTTSKMKMTIQNGAFVNAVYHMKLCAKFCLWDGIRDIAVMIILLSQNFS